MEELRNIILEEFGLDLNMKLFGDNFARNNVFLGEDKEMSYIIKLEAIKQLNQVKLSIKIARELVKSELICSSKYLQSKKGEFFLVLENKVVTVQVKEELIRLSPKNYEDLVALGAVLGEFHSLLSKIKIENLDKSDFYKDFMWGEVPQAQTFERLEKIKEFYSRYTPNYGRLNIFLRDMRKKLNYLNTTRKKL